MMGIVLSDKTNTKLSIECCDSYKPLKCVEIKRDYTVHAGSEMPRYIAEEQVP